MSDAVITKHLMTHPLIPEGVTDPRWQQLLLGLLNRNDSMRWGGEEISRWLAGESVTVSKDQESIFISPSHVQTNRHYRPYVFVGENYATPKALAAGLQQHWDDAVKHLSRDLILQWFKEEIKDQDIISFLMDLKEEGQLSPDIKLLRLVQRLDPNLPPIWKGIDVSLESLMTIANAAQNNKKQRQWLLKLEQAILGEFKQPHFLILSKQLKDFHKAWATVENVIGLSEKKLLKPEAEWILPQLLIAYQCRDSVEKLRLMLMENPYLKKYTWLSALGNIATAELPELLVMTTLVKQAETFWYKYGNLEFQGTQDLNAYHALPHDLQTIVNFLAVYYVYSGYTNLSAGLAKLGILEGHRQLKSETVRARIRPLIADGLLEDSKGPGGPRCNQILAEVVTRYLVDKDQFETYANVVLACNPPKSTFWRYNSPEHCLQEARIEFHRGNYRSTQEYLRLGSRIWSGAVLLNTLEFYNKLFQVSPDIAYFERRHPDILAIISLNS